jgi:hypothetical protein
MMFLPFLCACCSCYCLRGSFRGGKLGRITLEKAPDTVKKTEKESAEIHQNAGEGSNAPDENEQNDKQGDVCVCDSEMMKDSEEANARDENEQNEKQEGVSDCHSETVKEVNS